MNQNRSIGGSGGACSRRKTNKLPPSSSDGGDDDDDVVDVANRSFRDFESRMNECATARSRLNESNTQEQTEAIVKSNEVFSNSSKMRRKNCKKPLTNATQMILVVMTSLLAFASRTPQVSAADDFFSASSRALTFNTEPSGATTNQPTGSTSSTSASSSSNRNNSAFVWQPLPLRATFRPLNRQSGAPVAPVPPRPPTPPEPPAAAISERSISDPATSDNLFAGSSSNRFTASSGDDLFAPARASSPSIDSPPAPSNFFQPPAPPPTSTPAPPLTTSVSNIISVGGGDAPLTTTSTPKPEVDDDQPTRQPMNRFRPTPAPSDDADTSPPGSGAQPFGANATGSSGGGGGERGPNKMSNECFECICEASTNCNANSRCQTSDVRHTRCGMFLISYDQWLATGLSRELVTREALARDAAADERAFYECVTTRDCSERLLGLFMARNPKDCDRDGRIDCYDYAAIHHSGMEQCASESLLDSQYWNDFNACLGFGRRR